MEDRLSFWERLKDHIFDRERPRSFRDRTTAWVTAAVILLLTFVVWVVSRGATPVGKITETLKDGTVRVIEPGQINETYVDLLSDVALIIAASFTTVIGYYFGNRNAENQVKEMTAQAEEEVNQIKEEKAEISGQLEGLRTKLQNQV